MPVIQDEQATPSSPGAGKGEWFTKNTTPTEPGFIDDEGNVFNFSTSLSRGVTLGAAPSSFSFKVLDQGAGNPDILYASMQKSDDTWDWVEVTRAP